MTKQGHETLQIAMGFLFYFAIIVVLAYLFHSGTCHAI